MSTASESSRGRILAVDDSINNLRLVAGFLKPAGYEVILSTNGSSILSLIQRHEIELILLDISMPDISGLEICKSLKASENTADIPVIFMTALCRQEDKLNGFRIGCADYITKPFQMEEVSARIDTHLKVFRLQRLIRKRNAKLESEASRRTHDLENAKQKIKVLNDSKSEFLRLISLEIRTPLNGIFGAAELALSRSSNENQNELSELYQISRNRLMMLVDNALLLTQLDLLGSSMIMNTSDLAPIITAAISETKKAETFSVSHEDADLGRVNGDFPMLKKAITCLLKAANNVGGPSADISIHCYPFSTEVYVNFRIANARLKESEIQDFFDLWSNSELVKSHESLGLNPAVANRIIQLLGGRTKISNVEKDVQIEVWFARHINPEKFDD